MGTIRQIKSTAFPPPACHTTAHATAATATSTSNRNSTSNMSSKYSANNANKIVATTTYNTKITRVKLLLSSFQNTLSNTTQQKQQEQHLHPNKNNNNTTLWQPLKAVVASLLPLLAFLLLLSDSATPTQATPVFVDNPSLAQCE